MRSIRFLGCLMLCGATAGSVAAGPRLDLIRDRGYLVCGVLPKVPGFATLDERGRYTGFEIDICRGLAAAIFRDPDRVNFKKAASAGQFLADDDIDIVARRLTWTLTREAANGLLFSPIIFYDGGGFLVRRVADLTEPSQLSGRRICVREGSETQEAVQNYFPTERRPVQMPFASLSAAAQAFFAGECAALAADVSLLAGQRAARGAHRDDFIIMPEMISKEPLALLMRQGDEAFFLIVRWTIFALLEAEESGIASGNVDAREREVGGNSQWLLGNQTGEALGLDPAWVVHVIRGVGNYGEIFARHLGAESPIDLDRGMNKLWRSGGLMYAPPVR